MTNVNKLGYNDGAHENETGHFGYFGLLKRLIFDCLRKADLHDREALI